MRIDSHQHFWTYSPREYAWIDGSMEVLKRDFLPQDLRPLLQRAGIDACIAVQAQESIAETEWLLKLAQENPWIVGVVGWVDLGAADVASQLDRIAHRKLLGVRAVLQAKPDEEMANPAFLAGLAEAQRRGLVYDVLIYARQMAAALRLCATADRGPLVLDHFGKPDVRRDGLNTWERDLRALAAMPHVRCKVSGLATEANWSAWTESDLHRYFDVALEAFGPNRLLFGSDWPVALCAIDYQRWVEIVTNWISRLSPTERSSILGDCAANVYRVAAGPHR